VKENDLFFILKDSQYAIDAADGAVYSYITFRGRRAAELIHRLGITQDNCIFSPEIDLRDFWMTCLHMTTDTNIDLISESVLLYTAAMLPHAQTTTHPLIAQMISTTAEHFRDKKFSISSLSSMLNYSPKYLSAIFKREMGLTYREYLRNLRIKHANFLMEQGVVSVKNVAILSGFSDALYFSKVYKQEQGISPSEYIKNVADTDTANGV